MPLGLMVDEPLIRACLAAPRRREPFVRVEGISRSEVPNR